MKTLNTQNTLDAINAIPTAYAELQGKKIIITNRAKSGRTLEVHAETGEIYRDGKFEFGFVGSIEQIVAANMIEEVKADESVEGKSSTINATLNTPNAIIEINKIENVKAMKVANFIQIWINKTTAFRIDTKNNSIDNESGFDENIVAQIKSILETNTIEQKTIKIDPSKNLRKLIEQLLECEVNENDIVIIREYLKYEVTNIKVVSFYTIDSTTHYVVEFNTNSTYPLTAGKRKLEITKYANANACRIWDFIV